MQNPDLVVDASSAGSGVFNPHGRFAAKVEGRVIRLDAAGPFNGELAKHYSQGIAPLFSAVSARGPFGVLIEVTQSLLMGPDAIGVFADFLFAARQRGIRTVGTAYVVAADIEDRDFMLPLLEQKIYRPAGVAFGAFERRADAQAWLEQRLRDADEANRR